MTDEHASSEVKRRSLGMRLILGAAVGAFFGSVTLSWIAEPSPRGIAASAGAGGTFAMILALVFHFGGRQLEAGSLWRQRAAVVFSSALAGAAAGAAWWLFAAPETGLLLCVSVGAILGIAIVLANG